MLTEIIKKLEEIINNDNFDISKCSPLDVDRIEKIASIIRRKTNQYVRKLGHKKGGAFWRSEQRKYVQAEKEPKSCGNCTGSCKGGSCGDEQEEECYLCGKFGCGGDCVAF